MAIAGTKPSTADTHAHANNTDEQTVFENTNQVNTSIPSFEVDMSGMAQITTFKLYHKIDGTNYREIDSWTWNSSMSDDVLIQGPFGFYHDFKLTMQSGTVEGGAVDCEYSYLDGLATYSTVDTFPEITGVADIPATPTLAQLAMLLYMKLRNDTVATPTDRTIKTDAGVPVLDADMSDAAGVFSQGKLTDV